MHQRVIYQIIYHNFTWKSLALNLYTAYVFDSFFADFSTLEIQAFLYLESCRFRSIVDIVQNMIHSRISKLETTLIPSFSSRIRKIKSWELVEKTLILHLLFGDLPLIVWSVVKNVIYNTIYIVEIYNQSCLINIVKKIILCPLRISTEFLEIYICARY